MKALSKLYALEQLKEMTGKHLGVSLDYPVNIIDAAWSSTEDSLYWGYSDVENEDSCHYSEEASFVKEFDDCKMFMVFSCTGDKYIAIVMKEKECEIM